MPSSTVLTFNDPDAYAVAVRQGTVDVTVSERGRFAAKLTRIDLHRLWMQRISGNLARIAHVAGWGGRAIIVFQTQPGPSLLLGGLEMQPTSLVRHSEGQSYFQRSSGPASYGGMSLPVEDMASIGEAMAGLDLTPPRDVMLVTTSVAAMERLRRLHAAAGCLADEAPEIIANLEAARGLEQTLIEAMIGCLGHRQEHENTLAQGQHLIIMRRFRRVLEENPEQPLFIPEIWNAIRVSERTLGTCCQDHLRMSPKRYLLLRRMQLAQRALRDAAPNVTSVTEIATRYGFWQLGRFAVEYRSIFGESPSATLVRSM